MKERRHLDRSALDRLRSYSGDWTVLLDEGGRIVYELGSFDSIFGGQAGTPSLGRGILAYVHPDDIPIAVDMMEESLSRLRSEVVFEIRAGLRGGPWRSVDVRAVNCFDDPTLNGVILRVMPTGGPR